MSTWISDDGRDADHVLREILALLLRRDPDPLSHQLCVGAAARCVESLLAMAPRPDNQPIRFRVLLDGDLPGAARGIDTDARGEGTLTEPRLYQLMRQSGDITDRTLEITFLNPGIHPYVLPSDSSSARAVGCLRSSRTDRGRGRPLTE